LHGLLPNRKVNPWSTQKILPTMRQQSVCHLADREVCPWGDLS